jgi:hypothetical protein
MRYLIFAFITSRHARNIDLSIKKDHPVHLIWVWLDLDLKTSTMRCARAAQLTYMTREKIIDSSSLNHQRRQKSISILNMIRRETLMLVDLNLSRKEFDARQQRANCASIDRILDNQTCDVVFQRQSRISEITRHLTLWATNRQISADVHLQKDTCDVDRDSTDIFFCWDEIHKCDEDCSSISWYSAHTWDSLNRCAKTHCDRAST